MRQVVWDLQNRRIQKQFEMKRQLKKNKGETLVRKSISTIIAVIIAVASFSLTPVVAAEPEPQPAPASASGVVNINTADAAQLAFLPRIGEKAALRIIEYRKANGGFKKTTDLMQVKGVGEKSFELLRPYLTVDGKTTLTSKQQAPRKPRARKSGDKAPTQAN